jgi:hypothetical protein
MLFFRRFPHSAVGSPSPPFLLAFLGALSRGVPPGGGPARPSILSGFTSTRVSRVTMSFSAALDMAVAAALAALRASVTSRGPSASILSSRSSIARRRCSMISIEASTFVCRVKSWSTRRTSVSRRAPASQTDERAISYAAIRLRRNRDRISSIFSVSRSIPTPRRSSVSSISVSVSSGRSSVARRPSMIPRE